jgi:hypothetical protein
VKIRKKQVEEKEIEPDTEVVQERCGKEDPEACAELISAP